MKELYDLLLKSNPTIVHYYSGIYEKCRNNSASIYFSDPASGYYERYELSDVQRISCHIKNIVKVEKVEGSVTYPIWLKEYGYIAHPNHFVHVDGSYYSIPQLTDIIKRKQEIETSIKNIKDIINTISK